MSEPRDIESALSVAAVIPALDEARLIAGTLDALARVRGDDVEKLVVATTENSRAAFPGLA